MTDVVYSVDDSDDFDADEYPEVISSRPYRLRHLLVTQDYAPDLGGMARRHLELVRNFWEEMSVSTVAAPGARDFDEQEPYPIDRRPFPFRGAGRFVNQMRWARWLEREVRGRYDVIHCGNVRPVGYAVWWAHVRTRVPYLIYVNGGDLLRERQKARNPLKRRSARAIFGRAAGIVATSRWVAKVAKEVMQEVGVAKLPPITAIDLGTDPWLFHPRRDGSALRARWGVGDGPVLLTVARLVPHKGQDVALHALAALRAEYPTLRYVLVGDGEDEPRLRALAVELGVTDAVVFAGPLRDDELPGAYAAATIYVGLSRLDRDVNVEGFGISFLEAAATGIPSVGGASGGVGSAIRDGQTGYLVPPTDVEGVVHALRLLLSDAALRRQLGLAGRRAVEAHYHWERVAAQTLAFTRSVVPRPQD